MKSIRSAIYVPADNARALAKAAALEADALIFDLEDGVGNAHKASARDALATFFASGRPKQYCVVRTNHHRSPHYAADMNAVAVLPVDALMLPKVASAQDIDQAAATLAVHGRADLPLWCNVETPMGYVNIHAIAAHGSAAALVAGTNDLANDLRIARTPGREGLMHCLQSLVLAGRAHGKTVLDGTFIDLNDEAGLRAEATQGRMLGFDGKTLIHPKQIAAANEAFSPSAEEIDHAKRIIDAYEAAQGKGVTLLDGVMIEALHYRRALEIITINAQ